MELGLGLGLGLGFGKNTGWEMAGILGSLGSSNLVLTNGFRKLWKIQGCTGLEFPLVPCKLV